MNANAKKTPKNAPEEFIFALSKMGFNPGRWDSKETRIFDARNAAGHPELRIALAYEGDPVPHTITLVRFTGTVAQLIEWQSDLRAFMPTEGILALVKSSLPGAAKPAIKPSMATVASAA